MKNIYEISKEDLASKEKEFNKTAVGKKYNELKMTLLIMETFFIIDMIFLNSDFANVASSENNWSFFTSLFNNSTFWLGLLITTGFEVFIRVKQFEALKEYIEKTKSKDKE